MSKVSSSSLPQGKQIQVYLIIGDGDLSFSASISRNLDSIGIKLIASVLESEDQHQAVYQNSNNNIASIQSHGHRIIFGLDITKSAPLLDDMKLNRIQWNFPHCQGKVNIARNRRLISDFFVFCRSDQRLSEDGQVYLALIDRQGGSKARNALEWKQSWKTAVFAAECANLLLTHIVPFEPHYNLSSYKELDRPFHPKGDKQIYIFDCPNGSISAPTELQLYSYFSLFPSFVEVSEVEIKDVWTQAQVLDENFMYRFVRSNVDDGLRVQVKCKRVIEGSHLKTQSFLCPGPSYPKFAEYQILLFGEKYPLRQALADSNRIHLEEKIKDYCMYPWLGTRRASQLYPSSLLPGTK